MGLPSWSVVPIGIREPADAATEEELAEENVAVKAAELGACSNIRA